MFVSVQIKKRKQPDKKGAPLRIELVESQETHYYDFKWSDERFTRDNLDVYQFRLNHSYRANGQVKKRQWNICSLTYYDIATLQTVESEKLEMRIEALALETNTEAATLWQLLFNKLHPLQTKIVTEFEASQEYKVNKRNQQLVQAHQQRKADFDKLYDLHGFNRYNRCFDFYGTLRNPDYLELLKEKAEKKRQQEKQRAYEEQSRCNRLKNMSVLAAFNDSERAMLKEIYRMASKKFHPDVGGSEEKMKFLTQLKEQWGL